MFDIIANVKNNPTKNRAGTTLKYSAELGARFLGRVEALVGDAPVLRVPPRLQCSTANLSAGVMVAGRLGRCEHHH